MTAPDQPRKELGPTPSAVPPWCVGVVTLFPEMFPGPLGHSLIGRALDHGLWTLETENPRDHGIGRHRNVDDTPYGGGAGMVLRADVMGAAVDALGPRLPPGVPRFLLSPRGRPFTQAQAEGIALGAGAMLVCGRFEGVDERLIPARDLEEISLGDFVLTGGELAAMAIIDAAVRLRSGVLGAQASTAEESFQPGVAGDAAGRALEHPHYTRPPWWEGRSVPPVLLSGDHGRVAEWRRAQALEITRTRRPDLLSDT